MPYKPLEVKACLSQVDYTYVWNLTNTGKLGLFTGPAYHLICGASLISLFVGRGEVLAPGKISWKMNY